MLDLDDDTQRKYAVAGFVAAQQVFMTLSALGDDEVDGDIAAAGEVMREFRRMLNKTLRLGRGRSRLPRLITVPKPKARLYWNALMFPDA